MIRIDNNREPLPPVSVGEHVGQLYKLTFHPTEEEVAQNVIPEFGPYLVFTFKVVGGTSDGSFISGICSAKRHPKSKLVSWLTSFGLTAADIGEQLDEAQLVGKSVRLLVGLDKNQKLKITAMGRVNSTAPLLAMDAPLGFKPAARKVPTAASLQQADTSNNPPVHNVPPPSYSGSSTTQVASVPAPQPIPKPSTVVPPVEMDDVPF